MHSSHIKLSAVIEIISEDNLLLVFITCTVKFYVISSISITCTCKLFFFMCFTFQMNLKSIRSLMFLPPSNIHVDNVDEYGKVNM